MWWSCRLGYDLVCRRVRPGQSSMQGLPGYLSLSPCVLGYCLAWVLQSLIHVVHKARNDHGATSPFVWGCESDVLRDNLCKMIQCLCTAASFGNSEGEHMDVAHDMTSVWCLTLLECITHKYSLYNNHNRPVYYDIILCVTIIECYLALRK